VIMCFMSILLLTTTLDRAQSLPTEGTAANESKGSEIVGGEMEMEIPQDVSNEAVKDQKEIREALLRKFVELVSAENVLLSKQNNILNEIIGNNIHKSVVNGKDEKNLMPMTANRRIGLGEDIDNTWNGPRKMEVRYCVPTNPDIAPPGGGEIGLGARWRIQGQDGQTRVCECKKNGIIQCGAVKVEPGRSYNKKVTGAKFCVATSKSLHSPHLHEDDLIKVGDKWRSGDEEGNIQECECSQEGEIQCRAKSGSQDMVGNQETNLDYQAPANSDYEDRMALEGHEEFKAKRGKRKSSINHKIVHALGPKNTLHLAIKIPDSTNRSLSFDMEKLRKLAVDRKNIFPNSMHVL